VTDEVIAGRYRLEQRLGGGMSEIWAATDLDLDRKVAVKLLAPRADPVRFEREARAVAALAHPNICTLYSYGEIDGRPFMVLEYLSGGSLEERLAAGPPLPDEDIGRLAAEIAAGLAHAHARGVVHRDLKPANILFDSQGRVKIADFGIAQIGGASGLTEAGTVFGTAAYISPEQVAGEHATPASDVYAFGVILFRMLTGRLPFEAADAITLAAMHRDRAAPPVTSLRPDAPPGLESVAAAALAKSPADRPRDGAALLAELGDVVRPLAAETAATQVLRPARERGRTAIIVVAAAILATAGVALAIAVTVRDGTPIRTSTSLPETTAAASTAPPVLPATVPETTTTEPATVAPAASTAPELPPPTIPTTAPPPTTSAPMTTAPPATTVKVPPPTQPATTALPPVTTIETIPTETIPPTTVDTATAATTPTTTAPAFPDQPG
jgi:serine/threonine protein kinase